MRPPERRQVEVVALGTAPASDAREALDEFEVTAVEDAEAAVARLDDGASCLVCDSAGYDRIRGVDPDAPVVVVAAGTDVPLDRIVDDPNAEFVDREGALAATLPPRVRQEIAAGSDDLAWELASLAEKGIVQFDVETHDVLGANETFTEQWGLTDEDLRELTLAELRETDITQELRGQGRGQAGEEQLEWIAGEGGGPVETFVRNAMNGDYEVREWHCHDADGAGFKSEVRVVADPAEPVGYLVATTPEGEDDGAVEWTDTTAVTDDHDEASMLRSVMEHVPMSVYFEDHLGRHVLVSEDLVEPFIEGTDGKIMHTPEDVLGKTYFDLYTEDVAQSATADNEHVMETGEPIRSKERHVRPPHGRDLWFSTSKAPWYDDEGRVQGIVGVTVDITGQKRRERELNRQNERLEEFASIVSHDLRNPLNVADGRLELYRQTGDKEHLEKVGEMHERIADLIDEVLAFARGGSHIEDPEWVDGASQAQEAWNAVETAQATLLQEWDYPIETDSRRIVRLFENLFRNAVEHAGTEVTVEVGTLEDEGGFYVRDNGPGVPEAYRDDLFDRGTTSEESGTGYGLAIVKEIAEAHGWEVGYVDPDTENWGARFEFRGVPRGTSN